MKKKSVVRAGRPLCVVLSAACLCVSARAAAEGGYYTEEQIYASRPRVDREMPFGHLGVTGLQVRIYKGVAVTVEKVMSGSPAAGRFKKGDVITGVNGVVLKGKNPFVALGNALTKAEATSGRMVFDVRSAKGSATRRVSVTIPVLGAYSRTWPLSCEKSRKIVRQAAEYYSDKRKFKKGGMPGALAALFLLSTGDDKYLPRVKDYFAGFPKNVGGIGDHTWNNGYNGIACAEYYLRTGDTSVLPILQYYCDDAKRRQKFGRGWVHWGAGISPGYVASGLMNPAGAQVLTTLLLGKECGVKVDEATLLGALRFFYRFAGHGTVPYGDHRGEGGLGSNGKDGMVAAAMLVASGAEGDVRIYYMARRYLSMSMITSYPVLVRGHGDDGRGDGIWRSITTCYLMTEKPALYRQAMDRLTWWHDLSRQHGGSIAIGTLAWGVNDIGSSGPGVGLSYTAPRKTLRITGAPRSKYARDFSLPERLWGTEADLAFLSIEHNPKYATYGKDEPTHVPFWLLGGAYHGPKKDLKTVPREEILKNVYHRRYMIRAQAAKALRTIGALDELEKLLVDPDPRVRRAALDAMTDYRYWFLIGRSPIKTEQFSGEMLAAIKKMLADPDESWWVVDGALTALKFAPAEEIDACMSLIMPWTTHSDWWLREAAFTALSGLAKDDALYPKIVPKLLTMMTEEYHTQPRARMVGHLKGILNKKKQTSPEGELIMAGLLEAVRVSEIKRGLRSPEGAHNVAVAANVCLQSNPETAVQIAKTMRARFGVLGTKQIVSLVASPNSNREGRPYGLYTTLEKQSPAQREALTDILYGDYRRELIARMKAEKGENRALVDTIIDLTKLKRPVAGWQPIGKIKPADRIWRFTSFDPRTEKDRKHPREKKRFRDIRLPDGFDGWYKAGFDDSGWRRGKAPIGIGVCKRGRVSFKNNSEWGKGEFLAMRTTFELDDVDCDSYRLSILAKQGFHVYLNGRKIHTYIWWKDMPHYRLIVLGGASRRLKKGTNVLAAYANVEYDRKTFEPRGQMDLFIEGLKMADLE
ncbi:MAG: DUF6288 domain-containing protein [Planctomycetota bacterium]|jgi:hypothetical protein